MAHRATSLMAPVAAIVSCGVLVAACGSADTGGAMGGHCDDALLNHDESDVDCGGSTCPRCAEGAHCHAATDCSSGVCLNGLCARSSCVDGVQDDDETGVDCGGSSCPPCHGKGGCTDDAQCQGFCIFGSCCQTVAGGGEGYELVAIQPTRIPEEGGTVVDVSYEGPTLTASPTVWFDGANAPLVDDAGPWASPLRVRAPAAQFAGAINVEMDGAAGRSLGTIECAGRYVAEGAGP